MEALSRTEIMLKNIMNGEEITLEPITREEHFLKKLSEMASVIGGISAGGGEIDALIDGSITEVTSNAESVRTNAFYECKTLTKGSFLKAKSIGYASFNDCILLETVDAPLLKSIDTNSFSGCKRMKSINSPLLETCRNSGFYNCENLIKAIFPILNSLGASAFNYNYSLVIADVGIIDSIVNNTFNQCMSLKALVLRSNTICSLTSVSAVFSRCYHILGTVDSKYNPNGDKDGYIYVPRALIEEYKVSTNWTTLASQFRALEDYTVDGTTTGALDESKI